MSHLKNDTVWILSFGALLIGFMMSIGCGKPGESIPFENSKNIKKIKMIEPAPREGTAKYSPDGRFLAIGGKHHDGNIFWTGECEVYDTKNYNRIVNYSLPQWVNDVTFSPDSRILVVATGSYKELGTFSISKRRSNTAYQKHPGEVRLYGTDRFQLVKNLTFQHRVSCVTFSPDGKLLAVAENKNPYRNTVIHILETENWQELWSYSGHQYGVNAMVFSKDGRYLVSADSINDKVADIAADEEKPSGIIPTDSLGIHLVSLKDRKKVKLINSRYLYNTFNIALSENGIKLLCGTPWGFVIVNLDEAKIEPIRKGTSGNPVYVDIFPNERYFCTARCVYSKFKKKPTYAYGSISIYDSASNKLLDEFRTEAKDWIHYSSLTLSPDGKKIAVSSTAGLTFYSYDQK